TERRMTQRTDPAPFNYLTSWDYSANGWRTAIHRQNSGLTQSWTWTYLYNGLLSAATDPAGNQTTFEYDTLWRLISRTDAEAREYQFSYDLLSRISSIIDPMSNISEVRTYTDNGTLASLEDALTNVTAYGYDGFDRLSETTYPDSTTEQYSYNANNQVLTLITRKSDTITNTYDVLLRLSTRQPGSLPLQTFSFDLAGRLTKVHTPVSGTDPASGDFQYSFDGAGRLYLQTMPDGKTITYALDENGNRTKLTYPDGFYVNYNYDQLNRLTDISLTTFLPSVHFDYDELSRRIAITYDNLCVCTYAYELNNDMASLEHVFNDASSVKFGFDSNKVHQVIATTSTDPSYLWSPSGSSRTSYGTANSLNQYPSVNGAPFSYDNNGCLTGGLLTATFDVLNRMTQAVSGSTTNNYWFDPQNRQAQKTVNGTKTAYLNDGQQLLATYDGSGALVNRYIRGDGLNEVFMYIQSSTKTYLHYDRIGSVMAESDSSGSVSHKYTYGLFGDTASISNSSFGFTGQRYDSEIGHYNYRARYYSPAIGRFLQPDPIGYKAGMNQYSYVSNDPVNLTDPSGMMPWEKNQTWKIIPAEQAIDPINTGKYASNTGITASTILLGQDLPGHELTHYEDPWAPKPGILQQLKEAANALIKEVFWDPEGVAQMSEEDKKVLYDAAKDTATAPNN
ncbi:MAG: hypothetical protein K2X81_20120, partial [Candidatus Obscuribacterales bacterium]|nr:hypothetical protein [Candidatus Obscuribacterales bacterium]